MIVRVMTEDNEPGDYKVVPSSWLANDNETLYPKNEGTPCALEKLLEAAGKPLPRKSFKKIPIKQVYDSGELMNGTSV